MVDLLLRLLMARLAVVWQGWGARFVFGAPPSPLVGNLFSTVPELVSGHVRGLGHLFVDAFPGSALLIVGLYTSHDLV